MVSSAVNTAHTVVGVIGNVISFGLFLSPCPTFYHIYKKKDVEEFQPWPYLCTVLNCLLWVFYGLPLVVKDNILVTTINGVGLVIELLYLSVYFYYAKKKGMRTKVLSILFAEFVFMAIIVLVSMLALKFSRRALIVGIVCDVFNIAMYASPLAVWKKVVTTKSVEYMPFWLSVAGFANGLCWTLYGLLRFDLFLLISNGLGAFFGAIQLILYAYYYFAYERKKNKCGAKPAEVQLSSHA